MFDKLKNFFDNISIKLISRKKNSPKQSIKIKGVGGKVNANNIVVAQNAHRKR
jgi:hypothetical protein